MTITFVSNFLNHHQVPVADELYELTNHQYTFVATEPMHESFLKNGYPDFSLKPYLLPAWKNEESYARALNLCIESDICVFGGGGAVLELKKARAKLRKLSFSMSERWLKKGVANIFSPRLMKEMFYYHFSFKNKPFYHLCCSAFCSCDMYRLHLYKNKCYKWGYFTKIYEDSELEAQVLGVSSSESTPLMWCARFLSWKHPELPVKLAQRLKQKGYNFHIDMFGSGEELENTKALIAKLGVEDCVNLCGNLPNDEILKEMRRHSIFLFTSDRNEGWGAVANEAMSNGCVLVGSDEIGSVPYLVEDKKTGMIFKSQNLESLEENVIELLESPLLIKTISQNAIKSMQTQWSPKIAATRLMSLADNLLVGNDTPFDKGPCSIA